MNQTKKLDIDVFDKSGDVIEQGFVNVKRSNQMRIDMWIGTKYIDVNYVPVWPVSTPILRIDGVPMISVQNIQKIFDGYFDLCARTDLLKFIYDSKVIKINFDSKVATIDGKPVNMPSRPKILNETTFLPLQFMFEQFDCDVSINDEENTITAIKIVEPFVTMTKVEYFENIWIYKNVEPHKTLENTYVLKGNKTWEARKKVKNPDVEPIPREDLMIEINGEPVNQYKDIKRTIVLKRPGEYTEVTIEIINKNKELLETVNLQIPH